MYKIYKDMNKLIIFICDIFIFQIFGISIDWLHQYVFEIVLNITCVMIS